MYNFITIPPKSHPKVFIQTHIQLYLKCKILICATQYSKHEPVTPQFLATGTRVTLSKFKKKIQYSLNIHTILFLCYNSLNFNRSLLFHSKQITCEIKRKRLEYFNLLQVIIRLIFQISARILFSSSIFEWLTSCMFFYQILIHKHYHFFVNYYIKITTSISYVIQVECASCWTFLSPRTPYLTTITILAQNNYNTTQINIFQI
eukprot:TRINITY_DN1311_c1_g2_i2.p1 TRINITY_DN1311_c1_g2~~TRINITY_DN1311_c1_g2_i2.p1  ORF type:complete len:204 (-),score=-26.37 TRINITY_DN1311_c1_g2_i2:89-700(-)